MKNLKKESKVQEKQVIEKKITAVKDNLDAKKKEAVKKAQKTDAVKKA
jgi:hypothetical protein